MDTQQKQNLLPKISLLPKLLRLTGIILCVIWALFVSLNYLKVDDNFLTGLLEIIPVTVFYSVISISLFTATLVAGLTYTATLNFQPKAWLWSIGLLGGGILVWVYLLRSQIMPLEFGNLPDKVRVSLIIAGGTIIGTGFGLVNTYARKKPPLWFVTTLLALPFLYITLKAGAIAGFLILLWLFILADALGYQFLYALNKIFDRSDQPPFRQAGIINIAVGLQLLSLAVLGLGLLNLTYATSLIIFLVLVTILNIRRIKHQLSGLFNLNWRLPISLSVTESLAIFSLTTLFVVFWIGVLAPETGPDALGGRVALPALFLRQGQISAVPEMPLSYMSFTAETIYLLVMPLAGNIAAKLVHFGLAALLIAGAYGQVFKAPYRKSAALWLFAFWSSTVVWWQLFHGFVDLFQAFFYFTCILSVRLWLDNPTHKTWLLAAGILGAAAVTIKINGLGALVIAGIVVISVSIYRFKSITQTLPNGVILGVPAVLFVSPWLLRSLILTGNPVFPYANTFFKSPLALPQLIAVSYGPGLVFPDILKVPWDIFFEPGRFVELGTFNPFLLAIIFLAIMGLIGNNRQDTLWIFAGCLAFVLWLVTEQNSRYAIYAVYLLSLGIGIGLARINNGLSSRQRPYFQLSLLSLMLIGFWVQVLRPTFWMGNANSGPSFPTKVTLGNQTTGDYLFFQLPTYSCARFMNQKYGEQAKIWQANLRDHLYFLANTTSLPHGILPVTQPLNEILTNSQISNNYDEIHQQLTEKGFTHILIDTNRFISVPENQRQSIYNIGFERAYLEIECADRGLRLYKILPNHASTETTETNPAANLIQNPGFELQGEDKFPVNWTAVGHPAVLHSNNNTLVGVGANDFLFQQTQVTEGKTYELALDMAVENREHMGKIQFQWLDEANATILFYWQGIFPPQELTRYRLLQTAPEGAQHVVIYAIGGRAGIDNVSFSEVAQAE